MGPLYRTKEEALETLDNYIDKDIYVGKWEKISNEQYRRPWERI